MGAGLGVSKVSEWQFPARGSLGRLSLRRTVSKMIYNRLEVEIKFANQNMMIVLQFVQQGQRAQVFPQVLRI